uniref:Uncharacterized protein n=1 Tax=Populus trichocarpa TaxID=3694 RepID=A0A2K1R8C1_POPTR
MTAAIKLDLTLPGSYHKKSYLLWRPHSRGRDDVRRRLCRIKLVGGRLFEMTSPQHRLKCPKAGACPSVGIG